ncbi:putative FAD-linked oxidoreductase [subsurface metagenome]
MVGNIIISQREDCSPFEDVRAIKGEEAILSTHQDYCIDESKLAGGYADWLFFPKNEMDIVSIVNRMKEDKTPITISGARTGIVGSAVPTSGGAIISFDDMKLVKGISYDENTRKYFVRIQPGLTLEELADILKYKRFSQEHNLDEEDWVQAFKKVERGHIFPVDPTEMTAAVGGSIAANASGGRSFKYGAMRPWVKHLRVVIESGEVLDIERGQYIAVDSKFIIKTSEKDIEIDIPTYKMPEAKNAAGLYAKPDMDLIDLFIGSEGILGIITEVDLWLIEKPEVLTNALFFKTEEDAINFVKKLRSIENLDVEYIEFLDENAFNLLRSRRKTNPELANIDTIPEDTTAATFFEIPFSDDTFEEIFVKLDEIATESNTSVDSGWSALEDNERDKFRRIRHAVPEIVNSIISKRKATYPNLHKLGTDMSVTDNHLQDIMTFYHQTLKETTLEYVIWGHIGDNHVHVNILPKNMEELYLGKQLYKLFAKKSVEFGGSVSAEHGIGKLKHEYLEIMYGEEGVEQMRSVKLKLDPKGLFNRDNVFAFIG